MSDLRPYTRYVLTYTTQGWQCDIEQMVWGWPSKVFRPCNMRPRSLGPIVAETPEESIAEAIAYMPPEPKGGRSV